MSIAVLAAAFLFNLGQGVLRPSLPLYLQQSFAANYKMVTLIPVVFGAGKWAASLPTGFWLDRLGQTRLMVTGLLLVAASDIACMMPLVYAAFLGLRALAGVGWAMFGTVATTTLVDHPRADRRGRAISLFLMSETLGLLLGSAAGGWLYQRAGMTSPFLFEGACMVLAALVTARMRLPPTPRPAERFPTAGDWRRLREVAAFPGVVLMGVTSAVVTAVQTGVLVFLYPLYVSEHGRLQAEIVGYLVSVIVLGRLFGLWLGGRGADRWGRTPTLTLGLLVYGASLASFPFVSGPLWLGPWSFTMGAGAGVVASLPTVVIGDRLAPPLKGIAIGALRMAADTGMLLGPLVMGALADAVHLSAPFVCSGLLLSAIAWQCRVSLDQRDHHPSR